MKKSLFFAIVCTFNSLSAQDNTKLEKEFQKQNEENSLKFDAYVLKRYGAFRSPAIQKEIDVKRSNLAGFLPDGNPYFLQEQDIRQVYNSNADALNTAGTVNGLNAAYNGETTKYTIFDGGRVYEQHAAFNNIMNRITNKESSSQTYSAHSTGVAGFIGSKSLSVSGTINGVPVTGNIKGVASNSFMDSYKFATTVLPGTSESSTVFQKILIAEPSISNHSYGSNTGWNITTVNGANAWVWNGSFTPPGTSYDLQGTYYTNDRNYDQIAYNNPSYVIVKSAGNYFGYGPDYPDTGSYAKYYTNSNGNTVQFSPTDILPATNCSQGFDCIGPGSLAKNIIVVAATDVISTNDYRYVTSSDVVHSDYSSAGPRDDGAIKPDISATGTDVFAASSAENTTGSTTYSYGSGTSYSAPVVTGIIGLWMQISKDLFGYSLDAASAKTLMVHSAWEAGSPGPDPLFGWGYINAKSGAELLVGKSNNTVIFENDVLSDKVTAKKTIIASGNDPLKVTISWIDPAYNIPSNFSWGTAYNNRTSKLVNDLDLRVIDTVTNTIYEPWRLNALNPTIPAVKGDNTVDNVEQVIVDAPVVGREYRIEVSNKGTLKNSSALQLQNYSLLATGFSDIILGNNEIAKKSNIVVAPTVTKDIVKILNAAAGSSFAIYDLSGKQLSSGKINSGEGSIDLSNFVKGIYVIHITTPNEKVTKRVIKE